MVSTELFVPPRDTLRVLAGKHVLTNDHRQVEVPAGATIAEAFDLALASTGLDWPRERFVATVNEWRVPRDYWHYVKPKPGTTVVFRPVASGDSSLRSLLFLGVAIAAMFIAGPIGGALGGFFASAQGIALIGGAITLAGAFLINALVPIRPAALDSAQPKTLPMISGSQNEVRPWGPVPVVLGRHRLSPMYAAMPYSRFKGQQQYMHMLFCGGYGPLRISQLKIGDTPAKQPYYDELTFETNEGRPNEDPKIELFPVNVNEDPLSIPLKSAAGYASRRTQGTSTRLISIDLIAPNGIWIYNGKTGKYDNRPVRCDVRYRNVPPLPAAPGAWISRPPIVFTRSRDTFRMGDQWKVAAGVYDVEVKKTTADYTGTAQVADDISWATLRAYETGVPIYFKPNLCLIGLMARATDQFNGVINTFNCVLESYVSHWNGTAWIDNTVSSSPADLFHHVLVGPANARPRKPGPGGYGDSTGQIDYDSIQRWGDDCLARGYYYNAVVTDQKTVREVLADIAAAGRATVALRNGRWGVSFPRDTDAVSWHFTPRNSSGLKTSRIYRELPHALRVRWINALTGYRQEEMIVYNDTPDGSGPNGMYTPATATLFESVEFPGLTDSNLVHKAARYQLAQALLRPETHTLAADVESLRLERGDKIIMSTDTLLIGTGYGRVTAADAAAETCHVDSRVIMEVGKSYQITFTKVVAGLPTFLTRTVLNTVNETDFIKFDTNDASNAVPNVGDLFSFGETTKVTNEYRVLDLHPGADLSAQFTLVDDANILDQYDQHPVPPYDPGITDQPDPFDLRPVAVTYSERFSGSGITAKSMVELTVQIPRVGTIRAFEYQVRDIDANGIRPIDPTTGLQIANDGYWMPFAVVAAPYLTASKENLEAGLWEFRVRALFGADHAGSTTSSSSSDWLLATDDQQNTVIYVFGLLDPPPDITGILSITVQGDISLLEWDAVTAPNLAYYRVKYSPVTDGSATWGASTELFTSSTNRAGSVTRSGTFFVKAVTYAEIESVNALEKTIVTTAHATPNIIVTFTESPTFAGVKTDTQVQGLLLTLAYQSGGGNFTLNQGFYQFVNMIDLGAVFTSQVTGYVKASGLTSGDTISHWARLSDVVALTVTDPGAWSIELVYSVSQGPTPKTVKQVITDQALLTNLKLLVEAGAVASWPGTGGKWLDESGGGYDFFLGTDATVQATDPTFTGQTDKQERARGYWKFDGGDFFTYDSVNETWMDAIHKDNAKFSAVVGFYYPALDTGTGHYLIGDTSTVAQVGFQFLILSNKLSLIVTNGTAVIYSATSTATLAVGWHTVGVSIDEAAGTGTLMIDGVTQALTGVVYASPSAATATFKLSIGSNGVTPLPADWRMHSVAMWQGVALTSTQLAALGTAMQHNDDLVGWSDWTPFSVTDITGRGMAFGIRLNGSPDGLISPAVSQLGVTIDMPDRHLGFDVKNPTAPFGSGTSAGGYTINFVPPFMKLKSIALANYQLDTSANEKYTILSSDETHVTIIFTAGATVLDRTFSLHAYGYGAAG